MLLIDDQTRTYWDHITGRAVHGPLAGTQLEAFALEMTTVGSARRAEPDLPVALSKRPLLKRMMGNFLERVAGRDKGFLPPGFRGTMGAPDPRRPEMDMGLGVVIGRRARYYPMELLRERAPLEDTLGEHALAIRVDEDGIPSAVRTDGGERPIQLFTRWYGFAYTYPGCELFE